MHGCRVNAAAECPCVAAGVDGVGVDLQGDALRADSRLIERAFSVTFPPAPSSSSTKAAPVQMVGGLSH
jgi:hypothetical protein